MTVQENKKRPPPDNVGRKNWGAFAKNSVARGEENTLQIASWIYKFGYASNEIIQRVLNISHEGIGNELCKKGILEKIKTRPGFRDQHVFILTQNSVRLIERHIDIAEVPIWGGFIKRKYELHKTKRIKFLTLEHDLLVQHIVLDMHAAAACGRGDHRLDAENVYSGRELQTATAGQEFEPVFDASLYDHAQIEVELNQKSENRMRQWFYSRVIYLNNTSDYILNVHWYLFTDQNSIIDAISELLEEDYAKKIVHGKANKLIIEQPAKIDPRADLTRARRFITLEKLLVDKTRKSGGYRIANTETFKNLAFGPES